MAVRLLVTAGIAVAFASVAGAQQQFVSITGAPCATPPVLHCPEADCPGDRVINAGPVVEMKTRRTYFLDCKDGRIVADVVRLEKGHTEGLEPGITEELVKLMLPANGGRLQEAR